MTPIVLKGVKESQVGGGEGGWGGGWGERGAKIITLNVIDHPMYVF